MLSNLSGNRCRITDAPISAQALLLTRAAADYRCLVWVAADTHEMHQLHESVQTLAHMPLQIHLFQPFHDDPAVLASHLQLAAQLAGDEPIVILTQPAAIEQPLPIPSAAHDQLLHLAVGATLHPEDCLTWLEEHGFEISVEVYSQGEVAHRGGIIDCWPPGSAQPVRIEFFGNEIDSIRYFDDQTQCSIEKLHSIQIPAHRLTSTTQSTLLELLPAEHLIINPIELTGDIPVLQLGYTHYDTGLVQPSITHDPHKTEQDRIDFITHCCAQAAQGTDIHIFMETQGTLTRFCDLYASIKGFNHLHIHQGVLHESAFDPSEKTLLITERDFYAYQADRTTHTRQTKRYKKQERVNEAADIQPGDYVVHLAHGVGKYLGIVETVIGHKKMEMLAVEYAKSEKVYLPVTQAHLLTRYKSMGKAHPKLHVLNGTRWHKDRKGAEKSAHDLAARLLETQAIREARKGHRFSPDSSLQIEFEAAFPYTETEDQLTATEELKREMEKARPMDRLLCGDVGFGKTEVAMRCAFKAVDEGLQVAVLVPTTVLAQQHLDSFTDRMAAFPVRIDMVCRFRSKKEQTETLAATARGEIDILIGTHRLLSDDVVFKKLGLVIIDEEQRFGVAAKEKLKWLRREVDIITMSATPIPRTLYMSLTGVRDLTTIKTAPQERQPVETRVIPYDEEIIVRAIERERLRGGQVFYLHNRVKSIHHVENRLQALMPHLRIGVAHGQMGEKNLSHVMRRFIAGDYDLLLCTTIIESGVDIPNCNTLFVEQADKFGLSDLYQLRGRVGRSHHKAFAYFMLQQGEVIDRARERMHAIERYSGLGSGFRLAMRDLEMRGAGNLLGSDQSGHISAVGFDLYCQLLRRTVAMLKGKSPPPMMEVSIRLDFLEFSPSEGNEKNGAFIPYSYVEDENLRLRLYQRISALAEKKEIKQIKAEIMDRFGKLPPPMHRLLRIAEIRMLALERHITSIQVRNNQLMLTTEQGYLTEKGAHPRLDGERANDLLQALVSYIKKLPTSPSAAEASS